MRPRDAAGNVEIGRRSDAAPRLEVIDMSPRPLHTIVVFGLIACAVDRAIDLTLLDTPVETSLGKKP